MAEVITVVEHKSVPVRSPRASGQKALEEKHADRLERLKKKLPPRAWSWGNREIKFTAYCGVISLGDVSVEILPKIHDMETDDSGSAREALVHMLSRARHLKLHRSGIAGISLQKHSILDVFILHFCEDLHTQLVRGMIRKYIKREKNLNVLRGRLVVGQQLKHNLTHGEKLFCRYDELSADNIYNQILKYVLGILLKTATANRIVQRVSELRSRFEQISDRQADAEEVDSLDFDRMTERYEPVFRQCEFFLRGFYPGVTKGKDDCLALLFDMNKLFEAYVGAELRREARGKDIRVIEQKPQKYFAKREDSGIFPMKPDISLMDKGNNIVCIADAKWKVLDEGEKNLGISSADMYQIGSYASRYRVKSLVLLYPLQEKLKNPVYMTLEGTEVMLLVQPVDISELIERKDHSPAWASAILSFLSSPSLSEASAS